MTQLEFYKSFQFVVELLVAEGIFVGRLQRRSNFWLRLGITVPLIFLFSYLFPILSKDAFYTSFMFLGIFAITVLASKLLFAETWFKIIFCCVAGYTVQHMSYELYNLISTALGANSGNPMGFYGEMSSSLFSNPFLAILYVFLYVIIYFFSGFFFAKNIKKSKSLHIKNGFLFPFVIFILVIDILLNAIVVYYISTDGNVLYMVIVGIYNVICCGISLFLQFEVVIRKRLEVDMETMKRLHHQEREQYAITKENIELINLKCHDLKHQIRTIGTTSTVSSSTIKEIERVISIYDSKIKTDNEALDVILTEKSLLCNSYGIELSCIIDGKQLTFMDATDVYALFGNLFDNAIEAVRGLDAERRIINLKIKRNKAFVHINMSNCFDGTIEFEGGMPRTTKTDKKYHGYGMKSIKHICQQYGGTVSVATDNNIFSITLLFGDETNLAI